MIAAATFARSVDWRAGQGDRARIDGDGGRQWGSHRGRRRDRKAHVDLVAVVGGRCQRVGRAARTTGAGGVDVAEALVAALAIEETVMVWPALAPTWKVAPWKSRRAGSRR